MSSMASENALREKDVHDLEATSLKVPESEPASVPQHGRVFAWLQVVGAFFCMFNSFGLVSSFGVFQTYYQLDLLSGTSAFSISWIGSIQLFLLMFGGVAAGPFFDKGQLRQLLLAGTFLTVFGMMMTSLCREYWQLVLAQGLVVGAGSMCFFVPSMAVIPQYFDKHRPLALGIAMCGGNLGGIIYTVMFENLQPSVGFPWAVRTMGFIGLVTLLIPALTLKTKAPPKKNPLRFDAAAWKEIPYTAFAISSFVGFIALYIPFFYVQVYSISVGAIRGDLNRGLIPILNAGSLVGRLLPPFLAAKVGPVHMQAFCTLGAAITVYSWIAARSEGGIIAFSLFFGFFSGGITALGPAIVASLTSDLRRFGARMGMLLVPSAVGVLIGNPIGGALTRDSWLALQAFTGSVFVCSLLVIGVVRVSAKGFTLMAKV